MKRISFFLFLIFIALTVTTHAQERIVISSPNLHTNDTVLVVTPTGYQSGIVYPTLFLLHGWSGDYSNWSTRVPLQNMSDKYGFIIVCPDGFYNSWYVNNSDPEGMQWRHFFDQELYPLIRERFSTVPDSCFITGLSMGGHGSLNIFIDDPARFRAAGSMSGVMDLRQTSLSKSEVAKVLGPFIPENRRFDEESVINRVAQLQGSDKLLIISCGYNDHLADHSEEVAQECKKLQIPHVLLLTPGVHSWKYWDFALDLHLTIFNKILKGDNLGY
ncbi:MAG: esterase family protein [Prevotellaceae bacterium]|jgi:S-formylglutathione hydrolase FrmB|nr:esterase family protein [Prevotellaceae bacterium]